MIGAVKRMARCEVAVAHRVQTPAGTCGLKPGACVALQSWRLKLGEIGGEIIGRDHRWKRLQAIFAPGRGSPRPMATTSTAVWFLIRREISASTRSRQVLPTSER